MIRILSQFLIIIIIFSCNSVPSQKATSSEKKVEIKNELRPEPKVVLTLPVEPKMLGETVAINFDAELHMLPDSIRISLNSIFWKTLTPITNTIQLKSDLVLLGKNKVTLIFYWGDTLKAINAIEITYHSDVKPEEYTYKIVKSYAHNTRSYTQGLEFSEGFIYEGTGQYGESKLFKINLESNEVVQSLNLSDDVFGEGITVFDDKIYQLTWRSQVGFVYNKNTFAKLYEFSYPSEGWGLTNNGNELIMSDGSELIYFLDMEFIQEIRRVQVYDQQGPIKNLNELEYIDGLIYANVYGTNLIVAIDEATGKVVKRIDLTGLLDRKDIKSPVDVLNGIAYNKKDNQLLVTGKYWPKLYQIHLVEK